MDANRKPLRMVWLANVASPYRRPVWRALARHVRLAVALLEDDSRLQRDGRRGADWAGAKADGYRVIRLRTARAVRGEESYYAMTPGRGLPLRGADVVLLGGWESPAFWQALLSARLHGVGTVGFYESTEATNRFRSGPIAVARAWFFRRLDAIVVPGPAAGELVRTFGVDPGRVHVGFNAVDVETFADVARSARGSAPQAAVGHRFVYVGQLIDRKNVDGLLRAFAVARAAEDRLTIVGDGERAGTLQALVGTLGLSDAVRFSGPVGNDDLAALLAHEHTLVLPSHREVWGLVVNEALACGLGAVVVRSAGVAPSVQGMEGVVTVEEGDQALADGLRLARTAWRGPIEDPSILQKTPAAFAEVFAAAAEAAAKRR